MVHELVQELVETRLARIEQKLVKKPVIIDHIVLFLMLDKETLYDSLKSIMDKSFLQQNLKKLKSLGWITYDKSTRVIHAKDDAIPSDVRTMLLEFEHDQATPETIRALFRLDSLVWEDVESPILVSHLMTH